MFPDDRLGVAGLEGSFAHRAELRDEHRNERMPEHVVGEREFVEDLLAGVHRVRRHDRKLRQRVGAQPRREVRLDRDVALHPDLRDLGLDVDYAGIEAHGLGLQLFDFAAPDARSDAGEEADCEIRHECRIAEGLDVGHQLPRFLGRDLDRRTTAMVDAMVRRPLDRVRSDPVVLEGELEERREDAAAIVVGLQHRISALQVGAQDRRRELAHGGLREVGLQRLQFVPDRTKLARRKHVLLEGLRPLGEVDRHCGGERLLVLWRAIVRQRIVDVERQRLRPALQSVP